MALTPKPSVFRNGADDSLGAVDVYSPGSLSEATNQVSELSAASQTSGGLSDVGRQMLAQGLQVMKRNLDSPGVDLGLEVLQSLGLTPDQLVGFVKGFLPSGINLAGLFDRFSGFGVSELNLGLGFIRDWLPNGLFRNLNNDGLGTYLSSLFDALDGIRSGQFGDSGSLGALGLSSDSSRLEMLEVFGSLPTGHPLLETLKRVAITAAESRLAAGSGNGAALERIAESGLTAAEELHAKKSLVKDLASKGDAQQAADVIEDLGAMATPKLRRETVVGLLRSYRLASTDPESEYPAMATKFMDNLNRIDDTWLWYRRGDETIADFSVLRFAGSDALTVLQQHTRVGQSARFIGEIETTPRTVPAVARDYMPSIYVE